MENHLNSNSQETFNVLNPATGEEVATYPLMDREAVDNKVKAARTASENWSQTKLKQRTRILRKAAAILAENAEHYAKVISAETGKTVMDALLADVYSTLDLLKHYSKHAEKILKPVSASGNPLLFGRRPYYIFEPRGVVAIISPWNYPFTLLAGPALSAITAGNAVVLKPSSQTTGSGLIFQEILEKAGLPEGVIQVVTGSGSISGQALVENKDIDMLFFTGSTAVGKAINLEAAKRLIPAIMELGGKDVAIVTANADLDRAAHGVLWGGMTNSGQTCIGTELVLVDRQVAEAFTEKLTRLARALESGPGTGEVGSMTMRSQFNIVEDQLRDALEKGAKALTGGTINRDQKGMYIPPTILVDTSPDMKVRTEETFGPLLPVIPYDTIDEAVEIANSTSYGLSGSVFTKNMKEGREIAKRIKTGSVNINDVLITYALPDMPFGGVKQSGIGNYHGDSGLRAFTNVKSVTEYRKGFKKEFYWYPMPKGIDKLIVMAMPLMFSDSLSKKMVSLSKTLGQIRRMMLGKS